MLHPTTHTREIYQVPNTLPEGFIAHVLETFSSQKGGRILHNVRNQIRVYEVEGREINIKKFCIPPIINRIFYSIGLRTPKAKTTFQNAEKIIKRGFNTPQPFGYIIERNGGLINYSYFISEQLQHAKPMIYECTDKKLIAALAETSGLVYFLSCFLQKIKLPTGR